MSKALKKFIQTELEENLHVLIDPKKKNSFSSNRINVWSRLVAERIIEHLPNHLDSKKI